MDDILKPVCVATGNWGCGAFRGDPQLKSLIQMMAAGVCHRDLVYYTFADQKLCDAIGDMYAYLNNKSVTIGQLYELLLSFGKHVEKSSITRNFALFDFLYQEIESYNLDTASEEDDMAENKSAEPSKPAKRKLVQGEFRAEIHQDLQYPIFTPSTVYNWKITNRILIQVNCSK